MNQQVSAEPRVYIRRIAAADETELVRLMKESTQLHDPWISPPTTGVLFKYYLQRISRDDHEGYAICRKETDEICGVININNIVRGSFLSASLGYYAAARFHGQGYMSEGLRLLVHHACSTMGLHRLEANIQPENHRSQRLVQRVGFVKEGLSKNFLFINGAWRDHERWCYVHPRSTLRVRSGFFDTPTTIK